MLNISGFNPHTRNTRTCVFDMGPAVSRENRPRLRGEHQDRRDFPDRRAGTGTTTYSFQLISSPPTVDRVRVLMNEIDVYTGREREREIGAFSNAYIVQV